MTLLTRIWNTVIAFLNVLDQVAKYLDVLQCVQSFACPQYRPCKGLYTHWLCIYMSRHNLEKEVRNFYPPFQILDSFWAPAKTIFVSQIQPGLYPQETATNLVLIRYEEWPCATIFEDDVKLAPNFTMRLSEMMGKLPPFDAWCRSKIIGLLDTHYILHINIQ